LLRILLMGLVLVNLGVFVVIAAGWAFGYIALRDLVIMGGFVVAIAVPVGLVRVGAIRASCWVLVVFLLCVAVSELLRAAVDPVGVLVLALATALASLVLGKRAAVLVIAISTALVLGFAHAVHEGMVIPWNPQRSYLVTWTVIAAELASLALLVFLAARGLREDLRTSTKSRDHGYDLLLALSRASQAVQAARSPADVYRVVGDEAASLGFRATVFVLGDEPDHMTMPHLALSREMLHRIERLLGYSADGYTFPLEPGSHFERTAIGGKVIFFESTREPILEAMPAKLRGMVGVVLQQVGIRKAF